MLLLRTFVDAASPGRGDSDLRSPLGSKPPARSSLWEQGSYRELGREIDRLKADGYTKIHRHLCAFYIGGPDYPVGDGPQKRYVQRGVDLLEKRMPRNVYVPAEVSENGGHSPGEAKTAARPRERAAA